MVTFEWYDGPREGICELEYPECAFSFEIIAERWHDNHFDHRLFRLSEIEVGSVARAIAILHKAGPPTTPAWAPHGAYESEEDRLRIEEGIEQILSKKVPTRVIVRTDDLIKFGEVWLETHAVPSQ